MKIYHRFIAVVTPLFEKVKPSLIQSGDPKRKINAYFITQRENGSLNVVIHATDLRNYFEILQKVCTHLDLKSITLGTILKNVVLTNEHDRHVKSFHCESSGFGDLDMTTLCSTENNLGDLISVVPVDGVFGSDLLVTVNKKERRWVRNPKANGETLKAAKPAIPEGSENPAVKRINILEYFNKMRNYIVSDYLEGEYVALSLEANRSKGVIYSNVNRFMTDVIRLRGYLEDINWDNGDLYESKPVAFKQAVTTLGDIHAGEVEVVFRYLDLMGVERTDAEWREHLPVIEAQLAACINFLFAMENKKGIDGALYLMAKDEG